jgi:hypothetical protein
LQFADDEQAGNFETRKDDASSGAKSLVYFDLNGLRALNDRKGHDAGDRGIRAWSQRRWATLAKPIDSVAMKCCSCYRIATNVCGGGGDESVSFVDEGTHRNDAADYLRWNRLHHEF